MNTKILAECGILTVVGMAVIFFFVGLLIIILHLWVKIAYIFFSGKRERANECEDPFIGFFSGRTVDEEDSVGA
jgi:Na+-transporting methylmalonyl-CoA/oxaloacetate decarboxylase gamma subunit